MPWASKAQMRAAFAGALGPEMKKKAPMWSHETPSIVKLPERSGKGLKKMMMEDEAIRRRKVH